MNLRANDDQGLIKLVKASRVSTDHLSSLSKLCTPLMEVKAEVQFLWISCRTQETWWIEISKCQADTPRNRLYRYVGFESCEIKYPNIQLDFGRT